MRLLRKSVLFCFIILLLTGMGATSYGEEVRGVSDQTVKIGLMGDITGPLADVWIPISHGLKAYFKKVNDEGGVHGRKIEYILEDDRYSIPLALSGFKKLVHSNKIFALQAASGVGHSAAIIPHAEKEKVPLIAATAEKRFYLPARKYVFCPIPWYEDQANLAFEYIFNEMKLKNPTIALMYPDVGSGKDTRDAIRNLVKVYPVKKYKEVVITIGGLDFTSEVLSLKRLKPDVVYIHGYIVDTATVAKTTHRFKLESPLIVSQYGCVDKTLAMAGKTASRLLGINCFGTWDDDSPGMEDLRKGSLSYDPNVHHRDTNFIQGWFIAMLFHEGLKNAGRDLNIESYLKGLEAIRDFDTQGICGRITFGPDDHKSIESHRIYKANTDKKKFIPISGWLKPKK